VIVFDVSAVSKMSDGFDIMSDVFDVDVSDDSCV